MDKEKQTSDDPIRKNFEQRYSDAITLLKHGYERYIAGGCKILPMVTITTLTEECIHMMNCDGVRILFDRDIHMVDYTFRHSINVAVLSGIIAKWVGCKEEYIRDLVLIGLVHDFGKTQISTELLNKTDELTFEEIVKFKAHPTQGYHLLSSGKFSQEVLLGVLQHHERMDGSGYPGNLLGKDICLAARIVAVADIYDAMISNKSYRNAETLFVVIEELFKEMFNKLDPHICAIFLKNVKEHLVGRIVRMSDGSQAKIVCIEEQGFAEPIVQTVDGRNIDPEKRLNIIELVDSN